MDNIYKELSIGQIESLKNMIINRIVSVIRDADDYNINNFRPWTAIFAEYLNNNNKYIKLTSCKKYYKQDTLEMHFPTNQNGIYAPPFDERSYDTTYTINFVNTSTGTKIYEYAKLLSEAEKEFEDLQGIAVALTTDKKHRVKVIRLENNAWILTNNIDNTIVNNVLSLFPFIFKIEELIANENIKNTCKAVANNEEIKPYLQVLLDEADRLREEQDIANLTEILNTRHNILKRNLDDSIKSIQKDIQNYEKYIDDSYKTLRKKQIERLGYDIVPNVSRDISKEIYEFIDKNKFINSVKITNSFYNKRIIIDIVAPITIYESDPLDQMTKHRIETTESTRKKNICKALRKIFLDEEYKMECHTSIIIDLEVNDIYAEYDQVNKNRDEYIRIPNPHLVNYNCWGDNLKVIKKHLVDNEFIEALSHIIICCQNINFIDVPVFNILIDFIDNYHYDTKTCISKTDGAMYSFEDIIKQIEKEETETPELIDELENATVFVTDEDEEEEDAD